MIHQTRIAVAVWVFLSVTSSIQASPLFQGLGDLVGGVFNSRANGVSADGRVVIGSSTSVNGAEAFRWSRTEGLVGLGGSLDGGSFNGANAVSADGSVIVGRGVKTQWSVGFSPSSAIRWTAGSGAVELSRGSATALSADGSVVIGNSSLPFDQSDKLFRWTQNTGSVAIPVLNTRIFPAAISGDGSVVVGTSNADRGGIQLESSLPFRWKQEEGFQFLGTFDFGLLRHPLRSFGNATDPRGVAVWVSNDGEVIIGSATDIIFNPLNRTTQVSRGFRWTRETGLVKLDFGGSPRDASSDGTIIVGGFKSAFIWDPVNGAQDLKDVLVTDFGLDLAGWTLTGATGISDDGFTIVGNGINPDGFNEAWIVVIPEPGSALLLVAGVWGVGAGCHWRLARQC